MAVVDPVAVGIHVMQRLNHTSEDYRRRTVVGLRNMS